MIEAALTTTSQTRLRRHARALLDAALVLYTALLAARPLDEPDTFFHLSLGRAVLRAGARVVPEPTAFLDFDRPAVASEWLWSVLSYAAHSGGGYRALSWLGIGLGALAGYSALRLVRAYAAPEHADGWLAGVSAVLLTCVVQCRVAVRPELSLLIGLPIYLRATRAYARAALTQRGQIGLGLGAGACLWAQLHGSFVLAPALFALQVLEPSAPLRRRQLRCDGAVFLLLSAAMLSSPYGTQVGAFIGAHAAGDAPRYIGEMARPTWAMLNPIESVSVGAFACLLGIALAGMLVARSLFVRELLLAALGGALFATANRFIAEAALLAVPLVMRGVSALCAHFAELPRAGSWAARAAATLVAGVLLVLTLEQLQASHGPIGRLGVSEHAFALHAASALAALPLGAAVLTDYESSAPLGFVSDGRWRTFVDGRTPLYFDDTDFAVEREMLRDGDALQRGIVRYGAVAAVVRRDSEACAQLARGWSVALIEPLFTTFLPRTAAAITSLRACGARYLEPQSCGDPGLARDIARVRGLGASEFATFLGAAVAISCGGDATAALRKLRVLEDTSRPYARNFQRVWVEGLLRTGRFDEAAARMLAAIQGSDAGMVGLLQSPAAGALPLSHARRILAGYIDVARDEADVGVRAALAEICARSGDEECARFHATRVAVRGRNTSALAWLAAHHSDARVRRDAQRWLEVLRTLPLTAAAP